MKSNSDLCGHYLTIKKWVATIGPGRKQTVISLDKLPNDSLRTARIKMRQLSMIGSTVTDIPLDIRYRHSTRCSPSAFCHKPGPYGHVETGILTHVFLTLNVKTTCLAYWCISGVYTYCVLSSRHGSFTENPMDFKLHNSKSLLINPFSRRPKALAFQAFFT
jgi:hypothetical protein